MAAPDPAPPRGIWESLTRQTARRNGADPAAAIAPSNPPGPSLSTALGKELGLKLETTKPARDFLIIEGAERPKAN